MFKSISNQHKLVTNRSSNQPVIHNKLKPGGKQLNMEQIMEDSLMLEFTPDEEIALVILNFDDHGDDSFLLYDESDEEMVQDTNQDEDILKLPEVHIYNEKEKNIEELLDLKTDLSLLTDMEISLMLEFSPEEKIALGKYDKSDEQMFQDTAREEDIRKLLDDSVDDLVQYYNEKEENIGELLDNITDHSILIDMEQI